MSAENHSSEFDAWWKEYRKTHNAWLAEDVYQAGVLSGKESVMQKMPCEAQLLGHCNEVIGYCLDESRPPDLDDLFDIGIWLRDRILGK
jgi:hypothetical protein